MGEIGKTHVDDLYDAQGFLKRAHRLHPDFLRPLYQYTSAEIRNHQREELYPESAVGTEENFFQGNKLNVANDGK